MKKIIITVFSIFMIFTVASCGSKQTNDEVTDSQDTIEENQENTEQETIPSGATVISKQEQPERTEEFSALIDQFEDYTVDEVKKIVSSVDIFNQLKDAADNNDKDAQLVVAICYEEGIQVEANQQQSFAYLIQSFVNGNELAKERMDNSGVVQMEGSQEVSPEEIESLVSDSQE